MIKFLIPLVLVSCAKTVKTEEPEPLTNVEQLNSLYHDRQAEMLTLRDPASGWPTATDCDGMIWAGKYASTMKDASVNIESAEYPEAPGKFSRRPFPACWTPEGGDQGSATTWSRDMAVAGLLPFAFLRHHLGTLERHGAYAKAHNWQLGEPLDEGQTVYSPALIGLLFKTIYALGGDLDSNALWPDYYPAGLDDYQAHLLVMSIWLQGEVATRINEMDAAPRKPSGAVHKDISETMYARLAEQTEKDPNNPLYAYVYGKYNGDQAHTMDLLLNPAMPLGVYVRCDKLRACQLAEWLFTANLLLIDFGVLN